MLRQTTEDEQTATAAFLMDPASYSLAATVETMETHISRIFLTGERAFKMKRGVKLPYVDFSTADLGSRLSGRRSQLNSVTAPDLYLGVRKHHKLRMTAGLVSRDDGRVARRGCRNGPL